MQGRHPRNLKCLCHTRTHTSQPRLCHKETPKGNPTGRITLNDEGNQPSCELLGSNHTCLLPTLASVPPQSLHSLGPCHQNPHQTLLPGPLWSSSGDTLCPSRADPQASEAESVSTLAPDDLTADQMPHLEHSLGQLPPHLSSTLLAWLWAGKPHNQLCTYGGRETCPGQAFQGHSGLQLQLQASQHPRVSRP